MEQRDTHLAFECAQRLRHRRLRNAQRRSSTADTLIFDDGQEVLGLPDLHGADYLSA